MSISMKISKLSLRGKTYSYRSRIPQHLKERFASNGNDPEKVLQISLKTHDPSIALARKKIVDDWIANGGVGIVDFVPPRQHYLEQLALVHQQPIDKPDGPNLGGFRAPVIDPSILDGLQQGIIDPKTLTAETLAAIAASLADATGQPIPAKYKYTLRDALGDFRKLRRGEIQGKTLAAYDRAVALYLDDKSDVALDTIQAPEVALWIDGLKAKTAHATRVDHTNRLAKLFTTALKRGHCKERLNPFEDHQMGMPDARPVKQMLDSELLNILPNLSSDEDRAWAVLARYHGCRMAELAFAEIVTEEGIVCFSIKEIEESEWSPKTDAGTRLVPIRKALIAYAENYQPRLKNSRDYTKRFGNVKKKLYPDRNRTLVFHSLRHTFTTFAYRQGYNEQQVSWITGHKDRRGSGESAKRYFHGYSVAFLSEIIESIPSLEGFE
jgi:integrase